jgi:hypothetical protein
MPAADRTVSRAGGEVHKLVVTNPATGLDAAAPARSEN